jgi:N-acetylated-alpha-linked acidic dipeptidase
MKTLSRSHFIIVSILLFSFVCSTRTFLNVRAQQTGDSNTFDGFTVADSKIERQLEERFRAVPVPAMAREHLKILTSEPHIAGSPEDYKTALYVRDRFRSYGINADIKDYQVLIPYPKQPSVVELVTGGNRQRLQIKENAIPEDKTSNDPRSVPLFNGYSASGDVTAPLVYVNYGLPGDYAALKKLGVDTRGKIVIARYGNSFRGVKAKVAEQNGAIGLIIYSDPADDGYMKGDVYPKGPWRPDSSAQRGSVQYLFEYPGDPLTPGKPSVPGTARLKMEEATDVPRIPVQPISYGDARRLLEPLTGPVRPNGFQGGLPFAYHVGGNPDVQVHLKTDMDYQTRTIWDVIARIDGSEEKDRWVILGNHRDAWVFGAVDPNSGTSAMLEVARGLGELLKSGWKPRRTILLCSWDAEEYGLIGSTEWAEDNASDLKAKAVAYLNMDVAVSGPNFSASSVPSLWKLIRAATRDVRDPKTGKSVYEAWQQNWREAREREPNLATGEVEQAEARIGALGSGSDYTPFLQHLGVPSIDMGFGGDYGVYHSIYDSFDWMAKFGDPTFEYHATAAKLWGTMALRLANARALPFDYADYAREIERFITETAAMAKRRKMENSFDAQALTDAAKAFGEAAERINTQRRINVGMLDALASGRPNATAEDDSRVKSRMQNMNALLIAVERDLTDERGLRGRAWYKHEIYAPGYYTGYASLPLPDLQQAISDGNANAAREAAARIVEALNRATARLKNGESIALN